MDSVKHIYPITNLDCNCLYNVSVIILYNSKEFLSSAESFLNMESNQRSRFFECTSRTDLHGEKLYAFGGFHIMTLNSQLSSTMERWLSDYLDGVLCQIFAEITLFTRAFACYHISSHFRRTEEWRKTPSPSSRVRNARNLRIPPPSKRSTDARKHKDEYEEWQCSC